MIKFAKQFPDREIVSTLSRQLSWSHFVIICSIDEDINYEDRPMGIILCAGKDHDDIEYLEMDKTGVIT